MERLRNLPTEKPMEIASLIEPKKDQIISMALSKSNHVQMSLFTFSDKETVSEEEYFGDTMYLILEGETFITQNGKELLLKTGDTLMVPAHTLHAIGGKGAFKVLQITLNKGE
ncbi:MAG: cupin domain-containing protein [Peptostreptococcales bacterium]|jgi:quercetin dioxygenase-like cupin family protein